MAMHQAGLSKLVEELGELTQIAAKLMAYPDGDHPDGYGPLRERLQEEMADVSAAMTFVRLKLRLDTDGIAKRAAMKIDQYINWDSEN